MGKRLHSRRQDQKYPWGDTYVAGRCVDNTAIKKAGVAARDIADVDSSDCHGADPGFDQVYDLIGSVQEWGRNAYRRDRAAHFTDTAP